MFEFVGISWAELVKFSLELNLIPTTIRVSFDILKCWKEFSNTKQILMSLCMHVSQPP